VTGLAGNFFQQLFSVRRIFVAENLDLGPREARAINDAGMVQFVGDNEIVFAQNG
jgi:hypothetical protein